MVIRKIFTLAALSAAVTATSAFAAKDYLGAELDTQESFMYGRFEARMYMAASSGLVSSMFLYYNNSWLGEDKNEPWEEIDIEVLGKNPGSFQSNILSNTKEHQYSSEKHHSLNPAANAGYHTYALVWTPEYVSWEIDGTEVRRDVSGVAKSKQGYEQVNTLLHKESLRFNLWAANDAGWVGNFDTEALPQHQYINWIKVYSYDTQTKQFALTWKDDFDSFSTSRWATGNWDMEKVTYSSSNVNVKNGSLILSITGPGQSMSEILNNLNIPQDPNPELYNQDFAGPASSQSEGSSSGELGPANGSSSSQAGNPEAIRTIATDSFSLNMQKDGFTIGGAAGDAASWTVYDLNGNVLLKGSFAGGSQFVSTRNLPRGAYLLKIGGNGQTIRFVKP